MNNDKVQIFEGNPLKIKGTISRHEIVRKVINVFIDHEKRERGQGFKFRYAVEPLSLKNQKLYIRRPGGLQKWNFDFVVEIISEYKIGKGTHKEIIKDFDNKKDENPKMFSKLMKALTNIYECKENDVDKVIAKYKGLRNAFQSGAKVDVLLKVTKWIFIQKDIVYWNYQGCSKIFNSIKELEE